MNLNGDVKIFGHEFPKKAVIPGVAITLGIAGVVLYRKHQEGASASATDTSTGTDSTEIDPATGYAYGSDQDTAALAQESQQSSGSFQTGNVIGYDQFGNPIYGTGSTVTGAFSSNAEWTQAVITAVEDNGGNVAAMTSAIGAYLAGDPLTDAQVSLVQQAIALENQPPVAGASGFPPAYKTSSTGPGSTTGKKPTKAITGLNVGNITGTGAQLRWTNQQGATSYRVRVWNSPQGGIVHDSKSAATSQAVTGLKEGKRYAFHVAAVNGSGQGPYSATKTFTTVKSGKPDPIMHPGHKK